MCMLSLFKRIFIYRERERHIYIYICMSVLHSVINLLQLIQMPMSLWNTVLGSPPTASSVVVWLLTCILNSDELSQMPAGKWCLLFWIISLSTFSTFLPFLNHPGYKPHLSLPHCCCVLCVWHQYKDSSPLWPAYGARERFTRTRGERIFIWNAGHVLLDQN